MGFLEDILSGRMGLTLAIPEGLEVSDESDSSAMLVDRAGPMGWQLTLCPWPIDLNPSHREPLHRDVARYTRELFETYYRTAPRPGGSPKDPPRTADPGWSPLVDVEHVTLGEARALTVIHRMSYEPGNELLMGHLLVPTDSGTIELRLIAPAEMTGFRESALLLNALKEAGSDADPTAVMRRLGQRHYDDPTHDKAFPTHPLSAVRAQLRRLVDGSLIKVTRPAAEAPEGEIQDPEKGFAFTPPPRYARSARSNDEGHYMVQLGRVSFATTDGLSLLTVSRFEDADVPARNRREQLMKRADRFARGIPDGSTDVHIEIHALPDRAGCVRAMSYRRYIDDSPQHTAFFWLASAQGDISVISIGTSQCVPKEELISEAEAVEGSFRLLDTGVGGGDEATQKPWWKMW
jgi:hypothetical protein